MPTIKIHTDGGARGNPGPAAIGVVIADEQGKTLKAYGEFIGQATNNEAEYSALAFALKKAKLLFGREKAKKMKVECFLDSELVVKQLNGQYKLKEERMKNFFIEIWNEKQDFAEVVFNHVPREQNKEADKLVNQALDKEIGQGGLF